MNMRNNGLSIVLLGLFLACWAGQAVAGHAEYNSDQSEHRQPTVTLSDYLATSHFWEATLENWESEFLQMAAFVLLTTVLYQRGSAESKRVGVREPVDIDARQVSVSDPPWPVRRGGLVLRLYENSLGLVLAILFMASILGHAIAGVRLFNENLVGHRQPPVTLVEYATGGEFWFQSMQNWQSEFLSIWAMVVLTIVLRQKGSPESKPVYAANSETGR
jgi:hypothetical protein